MNLPVNIQLYFLHIPKTAGTSLRLAMMNYFDQTRIFPSTKIIEENEGYPLAVDLDKYKAEMLQSRLIIGHYPIWFMNKLELKTVNFTFIRNPVDRVLSHIAHYQKHIPSYNNKSFEEIYFESEKSGDFKNLQSRFLSFSFPNRKNQSDLIIDIENNIDKFVYIGLTNEIKRGVKFLNKKFNFNIRQIPKLNINESSYKTNVGANLISQIVNDNQADLALFDAVRGKEY